MAEARAGTPAAECVTVGMAVGRLAAVLAGGRVDDPRAEARDLVAAVVDQPRFWPSLHRDVELDADAWLRAQRAAAARTRGAPFAYAVGRASFRHLTLDVDDRVLIPRQETELLVEIALERIGTGGTVADVGTGSGAVALALANEGSMSSVIATDVSRDALAVAAGNARRIAHALACPVLFRHGSLLAPLAGLTLRAVVSNPPYIAYAEHAALPPSVRDWEPAVALYAAENGMAAIAGLVGGAPDVLEPGGLLAMEVDARRASLAAELAASDGRYGEVAVLLDLAGRERFIVATRR